jgi:hypothetical protein
VQGGYGVDLGPQHEESAGADDGNVDPFTADSYDLAQVEQETVETPVSGTSSSAGLAGLGAAVGESSRTGQAGPLPSKRTSLERDTLRIINPADTSEFPAIPVNEPRVVSTNHDRERQRTFRRHEDAGRWRVPEQEEVVDLPPLYTDIRQDGASDAGR